MASLKCNFCGYGIHHHGEPEGDVPVEYIFCNAEDWQEIEKSDMIAANLETEYDKIFSYAWRCERCGTFTFLNDRWQTAGIYAPKENFDSGIPESPIEFGPFWDEILWFDINELDTPANEILKNFPTNLWLARNENEMRLYRDKEMTDCTGQFVQISPVEKVTVETLSLEKFKKILANWDDIEFHHRDEYYNFMKADLAGEKIKIDVWQGHDFFKTCYSHIFEETENFVEDLINAKIFPDGKSIVEVPGEIIL